MKSAPQLFCSLATAMLLLATTAVFAQSSKIQITPPGTVAIARFFFDRQEISNLDYREYLNWLTHVFGPDSDELRQATPDTSVWLRNIESYNYNPLEEVYFRHPAYDGYPVVGVSYEQATQYCAWRTDRVYEMQLIRSNSIPKNSRQTREDYFTVERYLAGRYQGLTPNRSIPVLRYRLPTKDEWEMAASGNLDATIFPYGYDLSDKKIARKLRKGQAVFQTRQAIKMQNQEGYLVAAPAVSGFPNGFKLYNMIGNVAEMLAEKGICKGGSFYHALDDCKITGQLTYTQPEPWLGFRCVCVPEMPK
jgi:formylglycine-generating enzyme required for sulfatase activity